MSAEVHIPSTYHIFVGNESGGTYSVDADLDNMHLSIDNIPQINFGDFNTRVKELPRIEFDDFNIRVKELPKIEIDATTDSTVNVAITEIPDVRAHVPAHYNLGISFFGVEVLNFSLCGESQLITEKYTPRRMEICR